MIRIIPFIFTIISLVSVNLHSQPPEVIAAYELQNAIKNGKLEEIKKYVTDGKDINIQYNGRNALHVACDIGSLEAVKALLESGIDIKTGRDDGKGISTLQNAIKSFKCPPEIITLLLEKGADVNTVGPNAIIAVNEAVRKSGDKAVSLNILTLLLEKGANVDPEIDGNSPLINAILHNRPDMAELLIKYNADVNRPSKKGMYPIHYAVENKQIEVLKLLLAQNVKKEVKNPEGQSGLEYASQKVNTKYLDPVSKKKYQEIVSILSK